MTVDTVAVQSSEWYCVESFSEVKVDCISYSLFSYDICTFINKIEELRCCRSSVYEAKLFAPFLKIGEITAVFQFAGSILSLRD